MKENFPLNPIPTPLKRRRGAFEFAGEWAERVQALPETGMGYTIVSVELRDGRTFEQVMVTWSLVDRVRGLPDIPFTEEEIVAIHATHKKWDWKEAP